MARSAIVLGVSPTAAPADVVDAFTSKTGLPAARWFAAGSNDYPEDRRAALLLAAARVLTTERPQRSHAVVRFCAADAALPETERLFAPLPEGKDAHRGVQPSMLDI